MDLSQPRVYFQYFDGLGSTVLMTEGLGTVTDRYDYDAWGNEYPIEVSTSDNPYRYVGQLGYYTHWMDSSLSDLLHLGVRFYEPGVGRFGQRDPEQDRAWNAYNYAEGSPVVWVDPSGRTVRCVGLGASIAIVPIVGGKVGYVTYQCWDTKITTHSFNVDIAYWCAWIGVYASISLDFLSGCLARAIQDLPGGWNIEGGAIVGGSVSFSKRFICGTVSYGILGKSGLCGCKCWGKILQITPVERSRR